MTEMLYMDWLCGDLRLSQSCMTVAKYLVHLPWRYHVGLFLHSSKENENCKFSNVWEQQIIIYGKTERLI